MSSPARSKPRIPSFSVPSPPQKTIRSNPAPRRSTIRVASPRPFVICTVTSQPASEKTRMISKAAELIFIRPETGLMINKSLFPSIIAVFLSCKAGLPLFGSACRPGSLWLPRPIIHLWTIQANRKFQKACPRTAAVHRCLIIPQIYASVLLFTHKFTVYSAFFRAPRNCHTAAGMLYCTQKAPGLQPTEVIYGYQRHPAL